MDRSRPDPEPSPLTQRRLQALVEHSWDILSIMDGQGRMLYNSPACERIHGFRRDELEGRVTTELIHPQDRARVARAMAEILEDPSRVALVEYRYARKDGGWVWMEAVGVNLLDDPEVRGIVVNSRDITGQHRAEEALREEKERLLRIYQASHDAIYVVDTATMRYLDVNEAFERITGFTRAEALGRTSEEFGLRVDPVDRDAAYQEFRDTGRVVNRLVRLQNRSGRTLWAEVNAGAIELDGKACMVCTARDVTERILAQSALQKAHAAIEQSPAAILITDRDGIIEYANEAFSRMCGWPREQLLGRNPRILKSGEQDQAFYAGLWNTVLDGRTWKGRMHNRRRDGSLFWEEATISPLRDDSGQITHLVANILDITEALEAAASRERLEAHLARTQRLESLGSLAGGVAHDINNVLGAIMALASLHQDEVPEGSRLRRDLDAIVKACERGGSTVKGLLAFAREGLSEQVDVDVNALVQEQVVLLARTTHQQVRLETDLEPGLPPVKGDPSALSHLLMNLCVNALDAMPGGGTLALSTRREPGDRIRVDVADTGEGMTPEVLDRAMEPFFTTKPQGKGTGLGLPMAYGTAKAHGGRIDIASGPGRGTRVSVFLPARTAAVAEPAAPEPGAGPGRPLDMLVVDDDDLVRHGLEQLLESLGHRPVAAASGPEALAILEAGAVLDGVILDLNMPGMNGSVTLARLRTLRPSIPVIIATGRIDQHALELASAVEGVSLLPKPFRREVLARHLAAAIR